MEYNLTNIILEEEFWKMKALITGASSGIGREFAFLLAEKEYDLIITARRKERLEDIKEKIKNVNVDIYVCDLSDEEECKKIFMNYPDIDILINNAGYGVFGEFLKTELDKELEMLNVNIKAVHILTKLYYTKMAEKNKGYILNVASCASFSPGPLFSSYYASKAYVLRLTQALSYELKKRKSKVRISVLCPGPVDTEFNDVAGVKFGIGSVTAKYVAEYALKMMFKNKMVIVPSLKIKFARILSKLSPSALSAAVVYRIQKAKQE